MMMALSCDLANLLGVSRVVISDPAGGIGASLPGFLDLVRLMACFANRPSSCSEPLQRYFPDACKAEGISMTTDLRLQWTSYTNILRFKGRNIDAVLIPQNLGQQFPLLALLLIFRGSETAYLCLPNGSHPNIAAIPLAKQFAGLIPGGRTGIEKVFEDTTRPESCYLCLPSSLHFGHYVMNSLGPAVQALAIVRAAGASIRLARIENGFLPLEKEAWLLDPSPPPSRWIEPFPTMQALRQSARVGLQALMVLYGSSVDLSLAITTQRLINQCSALTQSAVTRGWIAPNPEDLVLGISLRGGTREAINLADVVSSLVKTLLRRGKHIFLVIDGMAASSHNNVSTTADLSQEKETALAISILDDATKLGARGISVVGLPLMDQLTFMSYCDLMLAHEGSSSAKSMWLLGLKTLIHAPQPPVIPKPRRPELQPVGLQFRHAYRGDTHPIEIRFPHDLVNVLPSADNSREARQRRNYTLDVSRSVLFIENTLERIGLLELR